MPLESLDLAVLSPFQEAGGVRCYNLRHPFKGGKKRWKP